MRMGQVVFVQMMYVCDAKVERGEEDDFCGWQEAEEMKGNEEGAEGKLFGCGTLGSLVRGGRGSIKGENERQRNCASRSSC